MKAGTGKENRWQLLDGGILLFPEERTLYRSVSSFAELCLSSSATVGRVFFQGNFLQVLYCSTTKKQGYTSRKFLQVFLRQYDEETIYSISNTHTHTHLGMAGREGGTPACPVVCKHTCRIKALAYSSSLLPPCCTFYVSRLKAGDVDAALDLMDGMEACEGYTSASEYNQVRLTSTAWHHQIPCGPGENMPWVFSFLSFLFVVGSYLRRYNIMFLPAALQYHKTKKTYFLLSKTQLSRARSPLMSLVG